MTTRHAPGSLAPDLARSILEAVGNGFEKQLDFTMEMMRHASLRGQEHTAQACFYDALASRGYEMDRWTIDVTEIEDHPGFSPVKVNYENAVNVVGTHHPASVQGRPVHVREAAQGANAIEAAYRLIEALKTLEAAWNERRSEHRYFETLDHLINFNIGKIAGGDWASSVPAWCTLDVRASIYPGVDPGDAAKEIEACLEEKSQTDPFLADHPPRIEYNGFFARGYVLEEGSDAERVLARAHGLSFNSVLESFVTPGYLDGRVFVLYDDCPCLVYGPVSRDIHAFDERVSLESLRQITATIALFIAEWCGLEPVSWPSPPQSGPVFLE